MFPGRETLFEIGILAGLIIIGLWVIAINYGGGIDYVLFVFPA